MNIDLLNSKTDNYGNTNAYLSRNISGNMSAVAKMLSGVEGKNTIINDSTIEITCSGGECISCKGSQPPTPKLNVWKKNGINVQQNKNTSQSSILNNRLVVNRTINDGQLVEQYNNPPLFNNTSRS